MLFRSQSHDVVHQRNVDSTKRAFIFTRSYFAGQQRTGANTWSGDVASTYGDNATHDKGAALHSYFSLFTAKGLVVSEWRTEGRETHPPVAFLS